MASGAKRVVHGSFEGTGAALNVTTLGFRPSRVHLLNVTAEEAYWQQGMADDSMFKRVAAGTLSLLTSNGITPLSNGFTCGADADINVAGQVVRYEAIDGGDENE